MFNSIIEAIFYFEKLQPNKLCVADDFRALTYCEYGSTIRRYALCLKVAGIVKGDKVVVEACQTVDYLAISHALQLLGAVLVPLEHNCADSKLIAVAKRVSARAIIAEKTDGLKPYNSLTYDALSLCLRDAEQYTQYSLPRSEEVSEILFSTGTTGKEKGIVITYANNIALAENVIHGVEMEKDNVEMIPSPMNHSHGLRRYYANMYNGSTVIILGSVMNVRRFFANLDTYGVNSIDIVPAALAVVLRLSKEKLSEYSDRIRYIQLGASPLAEQDRQKACRLLPQTRIYNFYGSTESGCTFIYNVNTENSKASCIGKPTYNTAFLTVDDDRNEVKATEANPGLLATSGKMNMLSYWQDEAETAIALKNGIIYSNDICYVDGDGDIILLGRKGDVMNIGGNKVSPEEIENAAKEMDIIEDCGCVPIKDECKGQVPMLFVKIARGSQFDAVAIRKFLSTKLEPFKVPTLICEIDAIPRSFNGKLLRRELLKLTENKQ